jgi:hypothetical protein
LGAGIGSTTPWSQLSVNPNGISGPAFAIGSSTAPILTVANSGMVGIGTANPIYLLDLQMQDSSPGLAALSFTYAGALSRPVYYSKRSEGTLGNPTATLQGDNVARYIGQGYNGTNFNDIAELDFTEDGAPSLTSSPGSIRFSTVPVGSIGGGWSVEGTSDSTKGFYAHELP